MKEKSKSKKLILVFPVSVVIFLLTAFTVRLMAPQEDLKSKYAYKDFESVKKCRSCHPGIYEQWSQAMMSQAYTHHWDEIEYFDLAVPHSKQNLNLRMPVDGCNGCHTPLAFMGGTIPSPKTFRKEYG